MVSCIVQTIAMMVTFAATLLTFAICGMPQWRLSVIAETNSYGRRIDGRWIGRWDGLWLTCVRETNRPMFCEHYSQSLSLTPDLKVSRIMISFAVLMAVSGCACCVIAMLMDKCLFTKSNKNRRCFLLLAGLSFISAGILVLIPVTMIAINIKKELCFSNCKNVQQVEIGEAIMLAWPTVMLFFVGGFIFCWYHPCTCKNQRCSGPSDECPPTFHQVDNHLSQELQVLKPNRKHNQDIVI